jgi:two-component system chemotaxis sensor kinase CheA
MFSKLSFNQRVWSGIGAILVLLTLSGSSSLFNLFRIDGSNQRVSATAVPVVTVANEAQIQLLKLANISANAFSAKTEEEITPFKNDFVEQSKLFEAALWELQKITAQDDELSPLAKKISDGYTAYKRDAEVMLASKIEALDAEVAARTASDDLQMKLDDLGQVYADIQNFTTTEERFKKAALDAAQAASGVDMYLQNITRLLEAVARTTDPAELETMQWDAIGELGNTTDQFQAAVVMHFEQMDPGDWIGQEKKLVAVAQADMEKPENFVEMKRRHLEIVQRSNDAAATANQSVKTSIQALDTLLKRSQSVFERLQQELENALQFGLTTTSGSTVVLLALALGVFLPMLRMIRKKMSDLAKLNAIGENLALCHDQDTALKQVLEAMSAKIGINSGSVFLLNTEGMLEARAFLPARGEENDTPIASFPPGKGIMGLAAESKKAIYVADTSRDRRYTPREGEKTKSLVCVPMLDGDTLMGVMNMSGEIGKVEFSDSDYEFVSTIANSLVTTLKNIQMVEVIEDQNRNLERKVEERTAELKQKNDDVANMLSNIQQGLFTVVNGGVIHPEYSAYLEDIFETTTIANRHVSELLFAHTSLSADIMDSVLTTVDSIIGEDAMMFEFNQGNLVTEFPITMKDGREKLLELDWNPIKDDDDIVFKLMVTVRDVTALRALQAEAEKQKQELAIIGEILAVNAGKFTEFITSSLEFIDTCETIIRQTAGKDTAKIGELFRNMHTVKGNARTYGFKSITEQVHIAENTYDRLRKEDDFDWNQKQLLEELETARSMVKKYGDIAEVKLGRSAEPDKVEITEISGFLRRLSAVSNADLTSGRALHLIHEAKLLSASMEGKPLSLVIREVVESVRSLAGELGKSTPEVIVDDGGCYILSKYHGLLNNAFMHLLRNAMDHGIEKTDERLSKGKPAAGRIVVSSHQQPGRLTITIRDDGRGIAIARIYKKAVENGLYGADAPRPPAADIANLIFASGFSTAEAVTEVSGRGVGMDAVRNFLQSQGGSIAVLLDARDELAELRPFRIEIGLPDSFFIAVDRAA